MLTGDARTDGDGRDWPKGRVRSTDLARGRAQTLAGETTGDSGSGSGSGKDGPARRTGFKRSMPTNNTNRDWGETSAIGQRRGCDTLFDTVKIDT